MKDKRYELLLKNSKLKASGSQKQIRLTSFSPTLKNVDSPTRIPLPRKTYKS